MTKMNTAQTTDSIFMLLIILILIMIGATIFIIRVWLPIKRETEFLKMEISRSDTEEERLSWERELKMLYISCIPLYGRWYLKRNKR